MHSRIFELSSKGIEESNFVNAEHIDNTHEWFVGKIADYVEDIDDRASDILWFKRWLSEFALIKIDSTDTLIFNEHFKAQYFESRFATLKYDVAMMTLNDFQEWRYVYKLKQLIESKNGFYIVYDDDLMPFDTFVREHLNPDVTYYIGGIVDYHC